MSTYQAQLSRTQARYLSNTLRQPPFEPGEERERWRAMMLQVLSATLSESQTTVNFSIDDLFDIREVASTAAKLGHEEVGLELLEICAKGLLSLSADPYVHDAGVQVGLGSEEEPLEAEKEKLKEWQATET